MLNWPDDDTTLCLSQLGRYPTIGCQRTLYGQDFLPALLSHPVDPCPVLTLPPTLPRTEPLQSLAVVQSSLPPTFNQLTGPFKGHRIFYCFTSFFWSISSLNVSYHFELSFSTPRMKLLAQAEKETKLSTLLSFVNQSAVAQATVGQSEFLAY